MASREGNHARFGATRAGSRSRQGLRPLDCAPSVAGTKYRSAPFYWVAASPKSCQSIVRAREFCMTSIAIGRSAAQASRDSDPAAFWREAFRTVRAETERRAAPLSAEDQNVQSMADASPAKWHRAHTTWFFETFLLKAHARGYREFDERFGFLFNSYYVAAGPRHARPERGLITRPDVEEVAAYRAHVDAAVDRLIESADQSMLDKIVPVIEIGLHHEQQHQE